MFRKSLEKVNDITEAKEKTEQIRVQIREKIKEARKHLFDEKTDRKNLIADESV